jgi:hypothetical protein
MADRHGEGDYGTEDALAFVDSMRLMLAGKTGFMWLGQKLEALTDYIERTDAERTRLRSEVERLALKVERLEAGTSTSETR